MIEVDSNQRWAVDELEKLVATSPTYEEQAFYRALALHFTEQSHRLTQAQGELDGRSWADKLV